MKKIKLIAVDIDGVLLADTFSPVLHRLTKKFQVQYTSELERNTFSQNRNSAASYLKKELRLPLKTTNEEVLKMYFDERKKYLKEKNSQSNILNGVHDFINNLKSYDIKIVCYGGLPLEKVDKNFIPYLKEFDQYICTNDFRPGLKEIIKDIYKVNYNEALFIDDVNRVAQEAKKYNIPFIGVPEKNTWGFQYSDMKENGVKYIVSSVSEIDNNMLEKIDSDNNIWEK